MSGVVVGGAEVSGVVVGGVVVGAAILRDGRLLAQCRARPVELAGRWELPGGRVEPGEAERAALRRECREELGVAVAVLGRVGPDVPLPGGSARLTVLRIYRAELHPDSPEPSAREHAGVRWVDAAELPGLDWLDADRLLLPDLAALLPPLA